MKSYGRYVAILNSGIMTKKSGYTTNLVVGHIIYIRYGNPGLEIVWLLDRYVRSGLSS